MRPVCPPASPPWATTASTPAASTSRRSSTELICEITTAPASLTCCTNGAGSPNESDTSFGPAARIESRSSGLSANDQVCKPKASGASSPAAARITRNCSSIHSGVA